MAKKTVVNGRDSFEETCSGIISGVISVFLLILTAVFPLIYHNSYFDILETKYRCYYMIVIGMLAVLLVLSLVMLVVDVKEYGGSHGKALFEGLAPKNWRKTFSVVDAGVLVFWLMSGISTLQSEYQYEAFWGNEGRYSGFFLITLYVAFYLVVSHFWKMKSWIVEVFLISGMVMCFIGITDYFQLDILHFRGRMKPSQSTIFTSTVGNINTYTAYVALLMGVAAARFATVREWWKVGWYYVCMTVTFFAIIMGCSENAYLALGGMFAVLPFVLLRSRRGTVRYLAVLATFATVIQCVDWLNQAFADMVIGLDSVFGMLAGFSMLPAVVLLLWLAVAALAFLWRPGRKPGSAAALHDGREVDSLGAIPVRIWGGLILAAAAVVCFMLFDANAAGHGDRYGALEEYLVFSDSWGTNRGYIWRKSVELYQDFPLLHKLFGYGPDTFGIMTVNGFHGDMINVTGQTFDAAHNEYLQFLLTIGPLALAGYLVFQIGACFRMGKYRWKNPYMLACMTGVVCYGFQALVNLNLPIATPMMWFLISVGMAAERDCEANASVLKSK